MDLGCMDLGCVSVCEEKQTANDESKNVDPSDSLSSASKTTKNKSPKGSPPSGRNALNRVESQIKKPRHRKTSPINWSPRRKVESYLKRKIKSLQEAGGMNDTLEETLGHANPHYCRVLREKMAAKEAACKVIEARKAAMVEASWCRILKAARIPTKEAEALLLKAEKEVAEALEAAPAKGVILYDAPDHPQKNLVIETTFASGNGSTTHTIKASFETAFEVDKQVAAAVKAAFIRLTHYSSFNKDEFKDLLRRISENPDTQDLSESDTGGEVETLPCNDGSSSEKRSRKKSSPQKYSGTKLVNMMLQRLKRLNEEELASLATIVATCGLNAALAETGSRAHNKTDSSTVQQPFKPDAVKTKQVEPELPSLDKFLVKKLTRLENEVQEAKNGSKAELSRDGEEQKDDSRCANASLDDKSVYSADISDLGRSKKDNRNRHLKQEEVPSLDKFLVKHVSKLEREVQEAKNKQKDTLSSIPSSEEDQREKENVHTNKAVPLVKEQIQNEDKESNLQEILVKPISRLEREKLEASQENESGNWKYIKRQQGKTNETQQCESLDKYLVKHVSRLEREKMTFARREGPEVTKKDTKPQASDTTVVGGLDQILVKHKSRLEREKTAAVPQKPEDGNNYAISRKQARERELLDTWGGIGLGGSMRPHVSRLERDKAAWIKAEKEERQAAML